ncbi:MAG: RluA family pseudouridine synthase [Phycisphaerae bacterium]|nr:RluA family pseudouridine synthase [Phycisphaerae bacterium]
MTEHPAQPEDAMDEKIPVDAESPDDEILIDADGLEAVETVIPPEADGLEHRRLSIRRTRTNRRLDKYLSGRLGKDNSRTALQRYIREGNVTVNSEIVKPSYALRPGDIIDMVLPTKQPREIPPEDIPLDIVYEDDDVLALNKQPNIIIHPARGNWTGTLVNGLAFYFKQNWRSIGDLPTNGQVFRPGIVHRLDRDTTGIILIAKSELALWRLGKQFELRKIQKTYNAIVHGSVNFDEDVIDSPIGKHPRFREKYAVSHKTGLPFSMSSKDAVTRYKVIERIQTGVSKMAFSFMELFPKTGRTHQLRVHMSSLGHPIVGDKMYGGGPLYRSQLEGHHDRAEGPLITRQALHARTIEFRHPRTGEQMKLTAPLPKDFEDTLAELRDRSF